MVALKGHLGVLRSYVALDFKLDPNKTKERCVYFFVGGRREVGRGT